MALWRILLVGGLVATGGCVGGDTTGSPDDRPGAGTSGPPPSDPAPQTSAGRPPTADGDAGDEAPQEWTVDEVTAARSEALSQLAGVRVTRYPDVVFAMADGRVWVSKASGAFESYDPATGTYRALHIGELGGVATAQEITAPPGWRDAWSLAWRGGDPFAPLVPESPGARPRVVETLLEARPSWEITWSDGAGEERVVVDRATGLIVEASWDVPGLTRGWSLTDVRPVDELPALFPGEVPDDVEIERPFTVPVEAIPLVEAARSFTPGLVAPEELVAGTTVYSYDVDLDVSAVDHRREEVTMHLADGFDVTRVVVSKFLPHDGITITDGDLECYDIDGDSRCDFLDLATGTVREGALAGRHFTEDRHGITVYDVGRTVTIVGVDPARSRRVAESFVAV